MKTTIQRQDMFVPLLAADPDFQPLWDAFREEWRDELELPEYLALADLARHLVAKLASWDTSRFDAIFDVIERWHVEGDDYVREAATIGLLENLQNTNIHDITEPDDFIPWLRPQSRRWWDKVDAFWRVGKIISDD